MGSVKRIALMLAVALVATAAVVGVAAAGGPGAIRVARSHRTTRHQARTKAAALPKSKMESALQAQGTTVNGDLTIPIDRTDITNVQIGHVPIKPSFEINGELSFQPLGPGRAFFNGDIALKPSELDPAIRAIIGNGLSFQAEHQHMYDFSPMVWFVHFRGTGNPLRLATAVHNVLKATATPLPQQSPANPKTPLDTSRLQRILHGYHVDVGEDGVVTVYVARRNPIYIAGIKVNPQTNIATNIALEPLNSSGTEVAAIPDIALEAGEVNGEVGKMQSLGWDIGCLYNQETDEHPQLYFSHQFKTGDPYALAAEIRQGLNRTNSQ